MPPNVEPRGRKTMSLGAKAFGELSAEKRRMEKGLDVPVSWDTFVHRHLHEVRALRGERKP